MACDVQASNRVAAYDRHGWRECGNRREQGICRPPWMAGVRKPQGAGYLPTATDGKSAEIVGNRINADRHGWWKCRNCLEQSFCRPPWTVEVQKLPGADFCLYIL